MRPIPVSIAKLTPAGLRSKARASSQLDTEGMNPWSLIAARSAGKRRTEDQNRLPNTTRAQLHRLVQVRHAKELGLLAQSLRDLDHAMAVAIRLHDREQRGRRVRSVPVRRGRCGAKRRNPLPPNNDSEPNEFIFLES